jgi:hypothetical protein
VAEIERGTEAIAPASQSHQPPAIFAEDPHRPSLDRRPDSALHFRPSGTLGTMNRTRASRPKTGFLKHHGLSFAAVGILLLWVLLYVYADPKTHRGSFFGNAIADWTGVVVTVIATKYFYEIGSAESRQPDRRLRNRLLEIARDHSLTIFLGITGVGWLLVYLKVDSEAKWGQVIGNILSEWTQLLGLVLMTKKLIEDKSKESR